MYLKVTKFTATLNLVILCSDAIIAYKIDFKDSLISIITTHFIVCKFNEKNCITNPIVIGINVGNMICVTE